RSTSTATLCRAANASTVSSLVFFLLSPTVSCVTPPRTRPFVADRARSISTTAPGLSSFRRSTVRLYRSANFSTVSPGSSFIFIAVLRVRCTPHSGPARRHQRVLRVLVHLSRAGRAGCGKPGRLLERLEGVVELVALGPVLRPGVVPQVR